MRSTRGNKQHPFRPDFRARTPAGLWLILIVLIGACAHQPQREPVTDAGLLKPESNRVVASGKYLDVVAADMDGDGHLDVVGGAIEPGTITLQYGDGAGGLSTPQYLAVLGNVQSVAVGDVNEDGLPDIVYSVRKQSSGIHIWLNQGKRDWLKAAGPIEINEYQRVRMADINMDGHLDIFAANVTSDERGGIQVWLGNGRNSWPIESGPTVTGIYMDARVADFNGDGHLDLIGSGWGVYGSIRVWLGDGRGHWSKLEPVGVGSFYNLSLGDINGDGKTDLAVGTYQNGVRVFQGSGNGHFEEISSPEKIVDRKRRLQSGSSQDKDPSIHPPDDWSSWQALPIDLDADGRLDLLAGSLTGGGIYAWLNREPNDWQPLKGVFPSTGTYYSLIAADMTADRNPEVCAAAYGEGIQVWPLVSLSRPATSLAADAEAADGRYGRPRFQTLENKVFKTIEGVAEYKIGAGDILEITLWDDKKATREEIPVRPDGRISYLFIEDLAVDGLTAAELDRRLTRHLKDYMKKPRLDIVVTEHNSKFVSLLGALEENNTLGRGQGRYPLSGRATVLQILTKVGGPSKDADLKRVRIRRESGQAISVNLFKAMLQGDGSQDVVLDDGDLVYVPTLSKEGSRVYVFGEVEKPGAYTFSGSEMRLLDALSEAGGLTPFGIEAQTRIVRGNINQPEILTADLERLLERGDQSQNILLAGGDLIYVPRSGWGDVKLLSDRIRPLLELIIWPARLVNDWNNALDVTGVK
jgi:protein involved in polysaccharide export with SLBB domain